MKNKFITIRKLAEEFGLSRTTLLYYDSIGILSPSDRSNKNYRLYSEEDKEKLKKIIMFREMGLKLSEIKKLLNAGSRKTTGILEKQLFEISKKINDLRTQQYSIINLLQNKKLLEETGITDKNLLVKILQQSGLDEDAQHRFHYEFETNSPKAHNDFLISLGFSKSKIKEIREWALEYKY